MIIINIDKAKAIAHGIRREKRAKEFKPYDAVIAAQIPGNDLIEAEAARQAIREKYALLQDVIDGSTTDDELKSALDAN